MPSGRRNQLSGHLHRDGFHSSRRTGSRRGEGGTAQACRVVLNPDTKHGTATPPGGEAIYAMNTSTRSAALILAVGLGLSTVASATTDESMSRQRASEARNTNQPAAGQSANGWRHTVGAPFRYAGRAGTSLVHSPMIIGETLTGERKFISRDGFMVRTTESKPEAAPAENSAVSINMGRGQRVPVMVDEK